MLTEDYRVRLDAFEGPLDLLLFLIRKHEVDIHDIPVARITDQYLAFLGDLERIDLDAAGEFLVMAASLMEIKSRIISGAATPRPTREGAAAPEEDPRAELVRQLLAYKQFRDAAGTLESRAEQWSRRFPSAPAALPDSPPSDPASPELDLLAVEDLALSDLIDAFRRICETVNFERLGEHQVTFDDTPIELHAEDILDRLRREAASPSSPTPELALSTLFRGRTRPEMVGLFIAILELVKRRAVRFRIAEPTPEPDPTPEPAPDPASPPAPPARRPAADIFLTLGDEPDAGPQASAPAGTPADAASAPEPS